MKRLHRNTRQRRVILEELQKVASHPTAVAVYEVVRNRIPKISLGTVYRNLELLARTGEIQKLDTGAAEARFDGNRERHDHVRCVRCGRIGDISGPPLELSPDVKNDYGGYRILRHRVEFLGVCPECDNAQQANSDEPIPTTENELLKTQKGDYDVGCKVARSV
jgi:Fur family transcriptional regulator, ferric uptake regulator